MAEKLTKKEAVRRALAALGNDAMPVTIQGWVKQHLNVEMTAGHVSTTKGELLKGAKKGKTAPTPVAPTPVRNPLAPQAVPGEKLTKNEAVRLAVLELGKEASRVQIQAFVKDHFGIEMNLDHVSTARALALRKLAENEKPTGVEEEAAPTPEMPHPGPVSKPASNGQATTITKIEAVRQALAALGKKAKVSAIQSFVKEHFNIEITAGHAKNAKAKVLHEGAKETNKKPASANLAAPKEARSEPAVQATPMKTIITTVNENGVLLEDILNLKALLARIGPKYLRTLVEVIAK